MNRFLFLLTGFLAFSVPSFGTYDSLKVKDTLSMSIQEVELMFLKNNYNLIAQKYNIDMADAAIKQSKLWYNPVFFFENILFNPNNHSLFENTPTGGQRVAQISKLVAIGRKRSKLVRLSESDKRLQEYAFHDLMRVLRFELFSNYALIYSNMKKLALLQQEYDKLKVLTEVFKMQYKAGTLAGYELTRLEFETQSVHASINDVHNQIVEMEGDLKMMLQLEVDKFVKPVGLPVKDSINPDYMAILDSAILNRPDLKVAAEQINNSERSLSLERAKSIPNLTVGMTYDRLGSAFKNYFGINVTTELPMFNRNQGNIKMAHVQVESSKAGAEHQKLQVNQDVDEAYSKLKNIKTLIAEIDPSYKTNLTSIADEAIRNYNLRVISLLDFIDKLRTYKSGQLILIDLNTNYYLAQQYLNFVSNTQFY